MKKNNFFSTRLKNLLLSKNMYQSTLASHLSENGEKISVQSVSHWIKNKSYPSEKNIERVAKELDVFPEYLKGVIDYPTIDDWKNCNLHLSTEQYNAIKIFLDAFGYNIPSDFYKNDIIELTRNNERIVINKSHLFELIKTFITMFDSYCLPYNLYNNK